MSQINSSSIQLSLVIPIYNEESNIQPLVDEITGALNSYTFEIIFINDGSTDNSLKILRDIVQENRERENFSIKVLNLRRNSGQTSAMRAGFEVARGQYTVTMDGDGQNDPKDIVKLFEKMEAEEVDVVCGWRKNRNDPLSKKIPSKLSNLLHRRLTGLKINDSGCTLRLYVTEAIKNLPIHGEDHRFLPAIIHARGFSVTQMEVNHRPRLKGNSKYGFSRLFRGYLDLISTVFVFRSGVKPFQFFSKIAFLPFLLGTTILGYLSYIRLVDGVPINDRPLLLLGVLFEVIAIQFIVSGLNAEVLSTHNSLQFKQYSVREIIE